MQLVQSAVAPMFAVRDPRSEQVSQALLGTPVRVLESAPAWRLIETPDSYQGWAREQDLAEAPTGWRGPWTDVGELWVNLRPARNSESAPVMQAFLGVRLPEVERDAEWVRVLLPDGQSAWAEAGRLGNRAGTSSRLSAAAIIRTARRFLGVPYLWGGSSPLGLDCSGFVQYVYRLNGRMLLRDAHQQATQGQAVDFDARRTGDLVFFGPADAPGRVTHVGLVVDRERYMHARGSSHVRIDPFRHVVPGTLRGLRRH